jgi:hypothetical protein
VQKLGPGDPQGIGVYRLLARLGAGGMGQVYLARSDRGRTVAVKLVRRELAEQDEFRARFRQEVEAARRVGGYWTAPVLDADTEAAVPWVATGYVAGPSLQQVVGHDHGALPERSVRILAAGLAGALQDIHAAGIVHRDLKPSNVLVTIDGPRVIDFGIARALETITDGGLTRTGALVGSPGFMAPEQVRGDRITPACDVFCLGSVLAYAATGALPFGGADSGVHALMFRIAEEEPDLRALPEGIADLVRDCLNKDPAQRPTLDDILQRTGAEDTVGDGRFRDPWLPSALVAQLGRHAVQLLDAENPQEPEGRENPEGAPGAAQAGAEPEAASAAASGASAVSAAPAAAGAASASAAAAVSQGPAAPQAGAEPPAAVPRTSPEHASAADPSSGFAPGPTPAVPAASTPPSPGQPGQPGQPGSGPHAPVDHLPTVVAGPPPGHPAYGHPQQHPQPGAYGYPQQPGGWSGAGSTPPYGPPPYGSTPPYGPNPPYGSTPPYGPNPLPAHEPRRNGRSTAALVAVALVVALGAGGSVYALMRGGGSSDDKGSGPGPSPATSAATAPTTPGPTDPTGTGTSPVTSPTDSPSPTGGVIPSGYLGTWTTTINNAFGANTRRLTIAQGGVGDTVLTLVADGPLQGGTYHCVFKASLTQEPGSAGTLEIGPSSVTTGQPMSVCSPGAASEVTLLPDGSLQRVSTDTGEKLTYTRQ